MSVFTLMKPSTATFFLVPFVLVIFLSSGCMDDSIRTELPASEVSVIKRGSQHHGSVAPNFSDDARPMYNLTHVLSVDGKKNVYLNLGDYYVFPGKHNVKIRYDRKDFCLRLFLNVPCPDTYFTFLDIDFVAEAGHIYHIAAERFGQKNWIWVEDKATGEVVAGERPSS